MLFGIIFDRYMFFEMLEAGNDNSVDETHNNCDSEVSLSRHLYLKTFLFISPFDVLHIPFDG
jgi:hypothetical protein